MRYLNLTSGLRSDEDLARYLFTTPDRFRYPSEKVGAMLHVPEEEMMEHLRGHIATYPERDPYGKYIHFKTEMDIRFTGMGEDRNRAFFWIVTPFYTKPFVTTVRRIGERSKNTLLFRDFLHALDPRTCVVPYFNNKLPLTNRLRLRLSNVAERAVRNPSLRKLAWRVVLFRNRSGTPALDRGKEDMRAWALDLLETSAVIREHFSGPATREILLGESDPDRINRVLALFIYMDIVGVAGESTVPLQNASSADHHYNRSG